MPDDLHIRRETRALPLQTRLAPFSSVNQEKRTAEVVFSTGAGVRRMDYWTGERYIEELSLDPAHVRLERLNAGGPLLAVHNQWDLRAVVGVIEDGSARIENGQGVARVRFDKDDEEADRAFRKVANKIVRNVSVGYIAHRYQKIDPEQQGGLPIWRAIDWEPVEISLVPVPADAGAQVRSDQERADGGQRFPCEFLSRSQEEIRTMSNDPTGTGANAPEPASAIRAERYRVAEIHRRVRATGLDQEFADHLVAEGTQLDAASRAIVDELARLKPPAPVIPWMTTEDRGGGPAAMQRDMVEGLLARLGGPAPSERARRYARFSLRDVAAACLSATGVRTDNMSADQVFTRAMSTSDFPSVLADTMGARIRAGYAAVAGGVKAASREKLARDFRAQSLVQLSRAATLEAVPEGAEYKHSRLTDAKESFTLATYGRVISIHRHAMVNDNLSAFDKVPLLLGQACREKENSMLCAVLTSNPTTDDGGALFNSTAVSFGGTGHANLGTGTGSALSVTSLSTAIKSMRLKTDLDASTPIAAPPKYLIVPAALEATARQNVSIIVPATIDNVNPWQGVLEVLVEPRLDASSSTAWYLAADPAVLEGLIHAYLEDASGPQLSSDENFDTDELRWKVRLDFTAGISDWRGLYKSNGA